MFKCLSVDGVSLKVKRPVFTVGLPNAVFSKMRTSNTSVTICQARVTKDSSDFRSCADDCCRVMHAWAFPHCHMCHLSTFLFARLHGCYKKCVCMHVSLPM